MLFRCSHQGLNIFNFFGCRRQIIMPISGDLYRVLDTNATNAAVSIKLIPIKVLSMSRFRPGLQDSAVEINARLNSDDHIKLQGLREKEGPVEIVAWMAQ